MTVSLTDLKKAKDKLEENIKELLYKFEKTNSFMVTDVKVNRTFVKNGNFHKNTLYNVNINITL